MAVRAGLFEGRRLRVIALGRDGQHLGCGVLPTGNSCVLCGTLVRVCVRCLALAASGVVTCMALLRALSLSVLARRGFAASEGFAAGQAGGWSMLALCGVGGCVARSMWLGPTLAGLRGWC